MGQARLTQEDHSKKWPQSLQEVAKQGKQKTTWQPIVIDMTQKSASKQLDELVSKQSIRYIVDNYDEQYAELIVSRQPQLYQASLEIKRASLKPYLKEHYGSKESWQLGSWVYYPWSETLVHVLSEDLFNESRTIRNKNLITADEQKRYAEFKVGCLGMSVGSNVALALVISGGSHVLKIADSAVISASNLNRIFAGVKDVGSNKATVIAQKLYEMNPYISVECLTDNVTADTVDAFFEEPWAVNAIVDEIDDLKMKVLLRVEARKRGIPVIMATDLGDDVMLDVERFDLDKSLPLFHGLVEGVEELLEREVGKREWIKYATSIVGPANASLRMQQSLVKIGTELVTQPQLGTTASMAGSIAAYALRQLALGEDLKGGRTLISLDKHLRNDLVTFSHRQAHRKHTKQLTKSLEAM